MRKSQSFLENETHKILWHFEIQTDHLTPTRRPEQKIIKKKIEEKRTCRIMDFVISTEHSVKAKENEKRDKNFDLDRELKSCRT